ncbi:hypothetical protein TRIUR3_33393 [Triticum urartu]|uniref:Uncharacterized protein n=1 Tax=Triticum urartu TaxID=4572 RepID=M7YVQ3_TRIUA|nr:hypothetical protein TRIUR3_33393 [Triticum urartu]
MATPRVSSLIRQAMGTTAELVSKCDAATAVQFIKKTTALPPNAARQRAALLPLPDGGAASRCGPRPRADSPRHDGSTPWPEHGGTLRRMLDPASSVQIRDPPWRLVHPEFLASAVYVLPELQGAASRILLRPSASSNPLSLPVPGRS